MMVKQTVKFLCFRFYAFSFSGMVVSVVGSALHTGMVFMGYHSVRSWWKPKEYNFLSIGVAGVIAG
jgi:hypothetical protein